MDNFGFGLASFAFWGFIASCVIGGIWYAIREKEAQHETLRRIIESGKDVNVDVIDRIMSDGGKSEMDLKVAGFITMSVAPGLVILGWFLRKVADNEEIFGVMLGVGGLVFCISVGLLLASRLVERSKKPRDNVPPI